MPPPAAAYSIQTQTSPTPANETGAWTFSLDIASVLWPIIVLILLLKYRQTIVAMVTGLSHRVSKLGFGGVSIELAKAEAFVPEWSQSATALDLRKRATAVEINDSTARSFLSQLQLQSQGDYSIVNLDSGEDWLTTRLYILSIVYARMKGVKCFVFVETVNGIRGRFLCWATPEKVRWNLSRRYPWLELAYSKAYARLHSGGLAVIVSDRGELGNRYNPQDPTPAMDLLKFFLEEVQRPVPVPNDGPWVHLDSAIQTYEHAEWIDGKLLEDILRADAIKRYLKADVLTKSKEEQVVAFLSSTDDYVAVVSDDARFDYLVDRRVILEQVANGMQKQ